MITIATTIYQSKSIHSKLISSLKVISYRMFSRIAPDREMEEHEIGFDLQWSQWFLLPQKLELIIISDYRRREAVLGGHEWPPNLSGGNWLRIDTFEGSKKIQNSKFIWLLAI